MQKRLVTSNAPPKGPNNVVENSNRSKKPMRKGKASGAQKVAAVDHSKKRRSDMKKVKNIPGGAEDSVKKVKKNSGQKKKKKKEVDSAEESRKKAKASKKKPLKQEAPKDESERRKAPSPAPPGVVLVKDEKENNSSRKEHRPSHPPAAPAEQPKKESSKRKAPAGDSERMLRGPPPSPIPKLLDSDKDKMKGSEKQKASDVKPAATPNDKGKQSSSLLPGSSPPADKNAPSHASKPTTAPAAPAPPLPAAGEEGSEEEDESTGGKTPPDKLEPNEGSEGEDPASTVKDKALELAGKGDTFTVGSLKLTATEALKGVYGTGHVTLKELEKDKKIEGFTPGAALTIKFEKSSMKLKRLAMEIEILKLALANQKGCVPQYLDSGEHGSFHCLVVDGLGPSLIEVHDKLNGFSPYTIFRLALVTLDTLRTFQSMLYVHRDIRPHTFYLGKEVSNRNKIVLGHMGFAKKFGVKKEVEPEEKCDLEMKKPKFRTKVWHPRRKVPFLGAVRYAPRSSHLHKEHTRRDDLESWFYMIYEFLNKTLPWKSMTDKDKILEAKDTFILDQKFSDDVTKKYGTEISNICDYFGVQNYYEMEPDFEYFESALLNLLKDASKSGIDKFDWEISPGVFDRVEDGKKTATTTKAAA